MISERNRERAWRIRVARAFRELFWSAPRRTGWVWRWLMLADDGQTVRRVGEQALGDLAWFCFAKRSTFDTDPLVMARRAGRREVWLRITNYLNLDEETVQKLMEIDDGY